MSRKTMILIGMIAGSIIGQYFVIFLGADTFSVASILGSGAGGMIGVWLGYKFS
ncbi:MAG: hypothetical protein PHX78_05065 [bacterium]|nr:hypothetical protein [bacterium]